MMRWMEQEAQMNSERAYFEYLAAHPNMSELEKTKLKQELLKKARKDVKVDFAWDVGGTVLGIVAGLGVSMLTGAALAPAFQRATASCTKAEKILMTIGVGTLGACVGDKVGDYVEEQVDNLHTCVIKGKKIWYTYKKGKAVVVGEQ